MTIDFIARNARLLASPRRGKRQLYTESPKAGRPTGLEPATARTTIWSSTIELRPPVVRQTSAEVKLKFYSAGFKHKSPAEPMRAGGRARKRARLRHEDCRFDGG